MKRNPLNNARLLSNFATGTVVLFALASGCGDDTPGGTSATGGPGGGGSPCVFCLNVLGDDGDICECVMGGVASAPATFCRADSTSESKKAEGESACEMMGGTWSCGSFSSCTGAYADPEYCSEFDPASSIDLSGGVYYVEGKLVSEIESDPALALNCGRPSTVLLSGGFELDGLNSGELFYELGLRNGDIPVSLNEFPLETYSDVADALLSTYYEAETEFELEILRSSTPMTLEYSFVFTKP